MNRYSQTAAYDNVGMSRDDQGDYVLYSEAQARIEALEAESQWERNKRQCAETRAENMRTAIRVYIAEKKQPGSDRRAEFAALATLERYAATEATR